MTTLRGKFCAICGEEGAASSDRFLVAEDHWEDKLTVLEWNETVAQRTGVRVACGAHHVEALVIHWMTIGSLDYPYARTTLGAGRADRVPWSRGRADLTGGRALGELSVHRESLERVLGENPQSLKVILEALQDALGKHAEYCHEGDPDPVVEHTRENELCGTSSERER